MSDGKRKWMDAYFAMFNCHVNHAAARARKEFVKKYGKRAWSRWIEPFSRRGIMSIFREPPNEHTRFYVETVHSIVNEGIPKPEEEPEPPI